MNFLPTGAVETNGYKNGAVLDKSCTEFTPYDISIRGLHVSGTPTLAPIVVDKVGPESAAIPADGLGKPYMAYAGFMVCLNDLTPTIYTGGNVSGSVQLSARKFRSRDSMHSDISPIYPPPAFEVSNLPTAAYTWLTLNTSTQQKLAQSFTVQSQVVIGETVDLSKNEQVFGAVLLLLRKSVGATGTVKVSIYSDNAGTPQFSQYVSRVINIATGLTDDSVGANETFIFDGAASLATGGTFWVVLDAANLTGTVEVATKAGAFAGAIKLYNGSSWSAGAAGVDFYFRVLPEGGSSRFAHTNFIELTSKKIGINGYWFLQDDTLYEDYDCIQLLIKEATLGDGFKVVATLPIASLPTNGTEIIFNGDLDTTASDIEIFPFYNRPFGGHLGGVSVQDGKQERMVLFGQPGFDNYTSMLNPVYLGTAAVSDIETDPILLFSNSTPEITFFGFPTDYATVYPVLNNRIITIYRSNDGQYSQFGGTNNIPLGGYEQLRAILSVLDNSGDAVIKLTNVRGSTYRYHVTAPDFSILRAEFRKQVFGQIDKWSDYMYLYFINYDGTYTAANIVDRWMINHRVIVEGQGENEVVRVDRFADGSNTGSPYINGNWYPTNKIRVIEPWSGEDGYGQFSLVRDQDTLFIGGGRADTWEGTAISYRLPVISSTGIRAIGICKGQLVAVCEDEQIFTISLSITDPATYEDSIGFDVTQDDQTAIVTRTFSYSFCGPSKLIVDDANNVYWQGSSGIYKFDLNTVSTITKGMQEKFKDFFAPGFIHVTGAVDIDHQYSDTGTMYFGGYALASRPYRMNNMRTDTVIDSSGTGNTDPKIVVWGDMRLRQNNVLMYNLSEKTFATLSGYGDIESMCAVCMSDGTKNVVAGAGGQLWLLRQGNYTYGKINGNDLYIASITAHFFPDDENGWPTIVLPAAFDTTPYDVSGWEQYLQAGVFIAKISENGFFELAEIISRCPLPDTYGSEAVAFVLRPANTWTISEDEDTVYRVIFGAKPWRLILPILIASPPNKSVRINKINARLSDGVDTEYFTAFEWPFYFQMRNSADTTVTPITSVDQLYTRTDTTENLFDEMVDLAENSVLQSGIFGGIHPPNADLQIIELTVYWQEQLGG